MCGKKVSNSDRRVAEMVAGILKIYGRDTE
jgi:hypothetical protein